MNHLQFQVSAGTIAVTWNSQGRLTCIDWYCNFLMRVSNSSKWFSLSRVGIPDVVESLILSIKKYFEWGEPIGDVPWDMIEARNWTDFQHRVYRTLVDIPHGETRTYAWVAKRLGNAAATRAVGQALRKNPLPILIPCHRVVSAQALGGFMGTSDPNQPEVLFKQRLIELENHYCNPTFSFCGIEKSTANLIARIP